MNEERKPGEMEPTLLAEQKERAGLVRVANLLLPFAGLMLIIIPFSIFAPGFLSSYCFKMVIKWTFVVGIAATGMTFVIINGGIDLSVGSVIALSTVVTALTLNLATGQPSMALVFLAGLAGVAVGGLCGLFNGIIITGLRIVPFVATLGMLGIARGVAKLIGKEQTVTVPPSALNNIKDFFPGIWFLLATVVLMWLLLRYTTFGRYTIAVGSNEPTARLCGVRVNRVKIGIYTLAGLLTGLAGVFQFSRLELGDPTVAVGAELDVIAAVVIGGGSLSGGEGSILGTLIGALAMAFLRAGGDLMGWGNYVSEIFIGIFIVIFVAIDQLRRTRTQ